MFGGSIENNLFVSDTYKYSYQDSFEPNFRDVLNDYNTKVISNEKVKVA